MAETLASIAVEFFADLSKLRRSMNSAVDEGAVVGKRIGQKTGDAITEEIASTLRARLGGGGIISQILQNQLGTGAAIGGGIRLGIAAGIGREIYEVGRFASRAGAEVAGYRDQLRRIAGDAKQGEIALQRIQKAANDTDFNTDQVFSLATTLAGRYGNVDRGSKEALTILDASADLGVSQSDFGKFQINLAQVLSKQQGKAEVDDIRQFRLYAPSIAQRISRANGTSIDDANKLLDTGSGQSIYNALLKVGEFNKGAATAMSARNPTTALEGLNDSLKNSLAPSGERINRVLTPTIGLLKRVADSFGSVNEATGGGAGIIAGIGALTFAARLAAPPLFAVYRSVGDFRSALMSLIISLEASTVAARAAAAANATNAASTTATAGGAGSSLILARATAAGAAGTAGAAAAAASGANTAVGLGERIARFFAIGRFIQFGGAEGLKDWARINFGQGLQLSRFARGAGGVASLLVPLGMSYVGQRLQGSDDPAQQRIGKDLSRAGEWASWGGLAGTVIGAIAGSVIPGLGTAVGAGAGNLIGTAVGGIGGAISSEIEQAQGGSKANENTKAIERNTKALEKVGDKLIGGGERTQRGYSQIEREWAIFQLTHSVAGGLS